MRWLAALIVLVVAIGIYQPVHTWLNAHLQFFFGVLVGSVAELVFIMRYGFRQRQMDVIEERASRPNPL